MAVEGIKAKQLGGRGTRTRTLVDDVLLLGMADRWMCHLSLRGGRGFGASYFLFAEVLRGTTTADPDLEAEEDEGRSATPPPK